MKECKKRITNIPERDRKELAIAIKNVFEEGYDSCSAYNSVEEAWDMKMKQAYEKIPADNWDWHYKKIELLPECKRVVTKGRVYNYQKARKKYLGIPYTTWINKNYIAFFPKDIVEYYECNCEYDNE